MKPAKEFRTLIANEESLNALLEIKDHLEDYLPEENCQDKRSQDFIWQDVLWGIWGQAAQKRRQQGYQDGTEGAERAVSGNF